jgi:predicted kinase
MVIAIVAAAAGVLIALACVEIPRLVARRNDPYNDADALAYEKKTGRSAQQIERDNAAARVRQQNKPEQRGGSGG